jgi:hypothetical protein
MVPRRRDAKLGLDRSVGVGQAHGKEFSPRQDYESRAGVEEYMVWGGWNGGVRSGWRGRWAWISVFTVKLSRESFLLQKPLSGCCSSGQCGSRRPVKRLIP